RALASGPRNRSAELRARENEIQLESPLRAAAQRRPRPAYPPSHPLRPLPQYEFLDLARAGLGHLAEHHVARALVVGEVLAAEGDDVGGRGRGHSGLELDEGNGGLAPSLVGPSDHGAGSNRRVLVEGVLDLDGGDVLAARDDDV